MEDMYAGMTIKERRDIILNVVEKETPYTIQMKRKAEPSEETRNTLEKRGAHSEQVNFETEKDLELRRLIRKLRRTNINKRRYSRHWKIF